jgi:hypothetical protein
MIGISNGDHPVFGGWSDSMIGIGLRAVLIDRALLFLIIGFVVVEGAKAIEHLELLAVLDVRS